MFVCSCVSCNINWCVRCLQWRRSSGRKWMDAFSILIKMCMSTSTSSTSTSADEQKIPVALKWKTGYRQSLAWVEHSEFPHQLYCLLANFGLQSCWIHGGCWRRGKLGSFRITISVCLPVGVGRPRGPITSTSRKACRLSLAFFFATYPEVFRIQKKCTINIWVKKIKLKKIDFCFICIPQGLLTLSYQRGKKASQGVRSTLRDLSAIVIQSLRERLEHSTAGIKY